MLSSTQGTPGGGQEKYLEETALSKQYIIRKVPRRDAGPVTLTGNLDLEISHIVVIHDLRWIRARIGPFAGDHRSSRIGVGAVLIMGDIHLVQDEGYMERALELARCGDAEQEVPVGALVVYRDRIIGEAWNRPVASHDPTAHAEILALRAAGLALGNYRLPGVTLYVTLEPCAMCLGAMVHARIDRLVFGAVDPKTGAVGGRFSLLQTPLFNRQFAVTGGVLAPRCGALLTEFFQRRR